MSSTMDDLAGRITAIRKQIKEGASKFGSYASKRTWFTVWSAVIQFIGVVLLVVSQALTMDTRAKLKGDNRISDEKAEKSLKDNEIIFWVGLALVFVGWIVAIAGGFYVFSKPRSD